MEIFVGDIETTGLINQLRQQGDKAKLHNLCVTNIETLQTRLFEGDSHKKEIKEFLSEKKIIVMHNGIGYDKIALGVLGYDISNITVIDTLPLSWYLDLPRSKHGLESYGEECGVKKPEIEVWEGLSQAEYNHRVKEDVRIQLYTYNKLKKRFCELYGEMTDLEFCNHSVVKYLMFKMEQLSEQEQTKFRVDVEKAQSLVDTLSKKYDQQTKDLEAVMPKVTLYSDRKKPAKPFKKDGSLSATGAKWKELTEKAGVDFDYDGIIQVVKGYDEPNAGSSSQIKSWLFSLGWIPETIKYEKNTETGEEREIPQIYIPQSGGQVCKSIERLAEEVPEVQHLVGLGVIKHRKGCAQGFIDSLVDGEYVEAGAQGFTNTLRLKHRKPCVNLPSSRVAYGLDVRGCLISNEGETLLGADLSALENVIKFNLQLPFDREYVESQMSDDFDPHLDIAVLGGLLTQEEVDFFKIRKEGFPQENYKQTPRLLKMLEMDEYETKQEIKRISKVRGYGKATNYSCLNVDYLVNTPEGVKSWVDIKVGDHVWGYDSESQARGTTKVLHKHYYPDAEVYIVSFDGVVVESTPNHRWLCDDGLYRTTGELIALKTLRVVHDFKVRFYLNKDAADHMLLSLSEISFISHGCCDVFCLTTSTGNFEFVTDINAKPCITGNCQYGAGAPTVARTAKVELKVGKTLVNAYRRLNHSINLIVEQQVKKETSFGTYQLNPFNGMWYYLKYPKDSFSTLVQGTGSYILDLWLMYQFHLREKGDYDFKGKTPRLLATFHDEQILQFKDGCEDEAKRLVLDALDKVNQRLQLEIPFGCDVQFGKTYADIH